MNIAIVTARSGSKGIPNKNIRKLGGIPLIGWTLTAASKTKSIDKIIFSTDSDEYFKIAKSFNDNIIFHKRTPELAEDVANELVVLDVLKKFKEFVDDESLIVVIQPTTPFISEQDIENCILKLSVNKLFNTCFSVTQVTEYPEWMILKKDSTVDVGITNNSKEDITTRQKLKQRWISNGGIIVTRKKFLEKKQKFMDDEILVHEMPKLNSIDIDEEYDFTICESLINSNIMKYEKNRI
jgi:CMP-N-acetylneuraminic acid synthetase